MFARIIVPVLAAALVAGGGPAEARTEPTPARMIGQAMVIRMDGTTPSAALLGRVRRGEVGGIVLFRAINISTKTALIAATRKLQAAAHDGCQPPLLIMADQEGGDIRTIPWAPTTYSARQMGDNGSSSFVYGKGQAAATALLNAGVNVNLAPVADVALGTTGFMYLASRTFSTSSAKTSRLALQFARGTLAQRVISTMKHFPGIGRVRLNTDRHVQTVSASATALASDLAPFEAAIAAGIPLIMLSNATYTAYDKGNAAGWSPAIVRTLLRDTLGFRGVSITDSLSGIAAARDVSSRSLALKALAAGTDMVMITGSESSTDATYDYLVSKVESGALSAADRRASYDRIVALKTSRAIGGIRDSASGRGCSTVRREGWWGGLRGSNP